jgi:hypothetical protein
MNKRSHAKPLADLIGPCIAGACKRQGFVSSEIVTHWDDIVGREIAEHAEPMGMRWTRSSDPDDAEPATLVLRVDGPAAIEIQHLAEVIVERVNRYVGWHAVGRIALRQAPLARRRGRLPRPRIDGNLAASIAAGMTGIADQRLREALGRLGAAVKGS